MTRKPRQSTGEQNAEGKDRSASAKVSRLREQIDTGNTGDKVAARDPAVAPLGTDAEAGGHPPTSTQVDLAEEAETKRIAVTEAKARDRPPWMVIAILAAIGISIGVALLWGLID